MARILAIAIVASLGALHASAAMLYKSIGPNGVIQFSDVPPDKGQVVAQMALPDRNAPPRADAGAPAPPAQDYDAALDKADMQLDLAEHALAQARRPVWTEPDILHVGGPGMTRADSERIRYFENGVRQARLAVADVVRRKLKAEASAVTMTASNEWVPVPPAVRTEDRR
ncbi:MAG TPA: DUF4124 domain-containing protein [Usitatibacter sp.]|jgi:hypothetical protein|nr:DUF4124 domain-containing protein [Usitatibacter sp.]